MPALKVWVANERLTSTDLNANFASVVAPDGVVARGSLSGDTTLSTPLPLTTVIDGKASYLVGGRIVTPRAGLYLVSGLVSIGQLSVGGNLTLTVVGTSQVYNATGVNYPWQMEISFPALLASGAQLTCQFTQSVGGPVCTIHRLGFLFLGTGYAP